MRGPTPREPEDRQEVQQAPPTEYRATSSPEKAPGSHGAGCSPFYEWLESRQRVEQAV